MRSKLFDVACFVGLVGLMTAWVAAISGPHVSLRSYPRAGIYFPGKPVEVLLILEASSLSADFYCPKVEWQIGERKAMQESDCDPWSELDPKPEDIYITRKEWLGPGRWEIAAKLSQGKVRRVARTVVEIR